MKALTARYRIRIYYHLRSSGTLQLTVDFIISKLRADLWEEKEYFPYCQFICVQSLLSASVSQRILTPSLVCLMSRQKGAQGCIILHRCVKPVFVFISSSQQRGAFKAITTTNSDGGQLEVITKM